MINKTDCAYPTDIVEHYQELRCVVGHQNGIDIRTYLAAKAMQGIIANAAFEAMPEEIIAVFSVKLADALIEELNSKEVK